eukprot:12307004-Ditylum_brightwellii.AAC.1
MDPTAVVVWKRWQLETATHKSNVLDMKPTTSTSNTATTLAHCGHCAGVQRGSFHATTSNSVFADWAISRVKEQEAVFSLKKKVDCMKGYDLDMSVTAAIMCLGTVLGSSFIMVAGGNSALGQAFIQLAII